MSIYVDSKATWTVEALRASRTNMFLAVRGQLAITRIVRIIRG